MTLAHHVYGVPAAGDVPAIPACQCRRCVADRAMAERWRGEREEADALDRCAS